jgi:hypothetical protein
MKFTLSVRTDFSMRARKLFLSFANLFGAFHVNKMQVLIAIECLFINYANLEKYLFTESRAPN